MLVLDHSLQIGKEELEAEVDLGESVEAGAFDVEDLVDRVVVEEVRDLELLVLLDQPLFLQRDC